MGLTQTCAHIQGSCLVLFLILFFFKNTETELTVLVAHRLTFRGQT